MALWERFIATGYFKTGQKSWTDEVMLEFHKQCKKDLMKPNDVTVNREIPKGEHTPDQVLEYTLKTFVDEVKTFNFKNKIKYRKKSNYRKTS